MSAEITEVQKKLDRILNLLQDDPTIGEDGLVTKVRKHGDRLDKLERGNIKERATVAGLSAGLGGLIGAAVHKIGNLIF